MWPTTISLVLLALPVISATPSLTVRLIDSNLHARQATTQLPKMNITAWDDAASAACSEQLTKLNGQATNPSGMAICYNLPFLDNSTGLFEADLRLYQVSAPSGDFSGVPAQDVSVGLQYFGATVQPLNPSAMATRDIISKRASVPGGYKLHGLNSLTWPITKRADGAEIEERDLKVLLEIMGAGIASRAVYGRQSVAPQLIQAYLFVGQVNKTLLAQVKSTSQLEGLLVPIVTLSALQQGSGSTVNTTLSSDEATFVTGVFANSLTPTQLADLAAEASASAQAIQSAKPFKLPGARILIFPVGGVVTGIWAIALMGTIGYGTVGRYRFQQQFRKRYARQQAAGRSGKFYGGL